MVEDEVALVRADFLVPLLIHAVLQGLLDARHFLLCLEDLVTDLRVLLTQVLELLQFAYCLCARHAFPHGPLLLILLFVFHALQECHFAGLDFFAWLFPTRVSLILSFDIEVEFLVRNLLP